MRRVAIALFVVAVGAIAVGTSSARSRAPRAASCGSAVDQRAAPYADGNVLFDRVALWPEEFTIPAHRLPSGGRLPWWGKQGLEIKAGNEPVDLVVPPFYRDRVAMGWGDANGGPRVHFSPCTASPYEDPPAPWFGYAGGFRVREPLCLPLVVRVGNHRAVVPVSLGAPCSPSFHTFTF